MTKINEIQTKLLELEGGAFQKLADTYLHRRGYERINPLGSVIGADKVRKGNPDTLVPLANGKYAFVEHTTQHNKVYEKLTSDLQKCFDKTKSRIPTEKIEELVFCHTSTLTAAEENNLAEECQKHGVNLNIFGIGPISHDLYQKYPGLARDFLGVEVDTGQIVPPHEFVANYNKNRLAARLDTAFHFRETVNSDRTHRGRPTHCSSRQFT